MIQVVNKYKHKSTPNDVYIGRGSPLGNPYTHLEGATEAEYKVATREEAIEKYEPWLEKAVMNTPLVAVCIDKITQSVLEGNDINLVCFCKPQDCHGDVIKKYIERRVWDEKSFIIKL